MKNSKSPMKMSWLASGENIFDYNEPSWQKLVWIVFVSMDMSIGLIHADSWKGIRKDWFQSPYQGYIDNLNKNIITNILWS